MKVCFLITGVPRRFSKYLYVYLQKLEEYLDFDVYLYFPKENCDENYANEIFNPSTLQAVVENPRYKLLLLDSQVPSLPDYLSRKQMNCIFQWYRIHKCFQFVPSNTYDLIVRIRPDIELLINQEHLVHLFKQSHDGISIPEGFEDESHMNDQIAFGSYSAMKKYCSLYENLRIDRDFSIETLLLNYIHRENIQVHRINLPYKLVLTDCKIIAIAGDSASGKSTLMNSIQKIMPTDSSLCIETDSYHKWERDDAHWKQITHLNPEANHLERMSEDVLRLKIGNNVSMVEYDHSTGKFTQEKLTKGKPFILFCGLHTLYKKNLLKDLDIKIFLDTHDSLKQEWKVKRDTVERNHSVEKVLDSIAKRKHDSETFILPQKEYSNFIVEYLQENDSVLVDLTLSSLFSSVVHPFSEFFSSSSTLLPNGMTKYRLRSSKTTEDIFHYLQQLRNKLFYLPPLHHLEDGSTGILQMILFLLLFYDYE